MLVNNMTQLRQRYPDARIMVFCESQMSWFEPQEVQRIIKKPIFEPIDFFSNHKDGDWPGVTTGEDQKASGVNHLQRVLRDGSLYYAHSSQMISMRPHNSPKVLIKQMYDHRYEYEEAKDPRFGKPKVRTTGKGRGNKDDRVMCLTLLLHWSDLALRIPGWDDLLTDSSRRYPLRMFVHLR